GFVWRTDERDRPWVGVACEGTGASLWWPCKDHLSDEPDSMAISLTVPANLQAVANGQFRGRTLLDSGRTARHDWFVSYPINTYNVTLNVGDYVHFDDVYVGTSGDTLALDYYVLRGREERARAHFEQVKPMLATYERLFGPYPFWRDGYALVEADYWGMEHQGAIAYGNGFENLPRWDFDYIIVHESGHEYWGNSVSCGDHAEMWIHESFCTYSELLFVEERFGRAASVAYAREQTRQYAIANQEPMLGPLGVNYTGWDDADMYYKGAWMLHTLRGTVRDDSLWFGALRGLAERFRRQVVTSEQVVGYLSRALGRDLRPFFAQYLLRAEPPQLVYRSEGAGVAYRWENAAPGFTMPLRVRTPGGTWRWVTPTDAWQRFEPARRLRKRHRKLEADTDTFYVSIHAL
ncbi:MAG: M1 family metallopeptidase, partial [Catalinimonas sp.]